MSGLSLTEIGFINGIDICQLATPAGQAWNSTLTYIQTCPGFKALCWTRSEGIVSLVILWQNEEFFKEYTDSLGIGLCAGFFTHMNQQQYKSLTVSECENFYKNLEISEYFPGSKPQFQSKSFARLTKIVNNPSNKVPRPKSQLSSLPDLLSETPSIKFTPRERRGCCGPHDRAWNPRKDAAKDIRKGDKGWNLGAPTPSGGYVYMKDFQGPRDTSYWFQRKPETRARRKPSNTVVDLVQITFKPGIVDHFQKEKERREAPEASQEFMQSRQESDQSKEQNPIVLPREEVLAWSTMRTKLLGLNGCSEISYGICLEPADTVFLCISWEDSGAREKDLSFRLTIPEEMFIDLGPYLQRPPSSTYHPIPFTSLDHYHTEVLKFYVPAFPESREVFEHYYYTFIFSLRNHMIGGGVHVQGAGYASRAALVPSQHSTSASELNTDVFVSVINWHTRGSSLWYQDFYEGMMKSYERLGWRLEGLKCIVNACESSMVGDTQRWSGKWEDKLVDGIIGIYF